MKIHLEELEHQRTALDAIINTIPTLSGKESNLYANPILCNAWDEHKFIDIKMETGTGKTYVYTRAMYELHQKYGIYKFIIVVPSLAIKEGTKNFITSDYARQHFSLFFPNQRIELQTVNAGDFNTKKGKRKTIPSALTQFCEATKNDRNTIQCLLLSDKGFLDRKDSALFKNDYDQTLFGGYACPADALKNTFPVLIIDEPHRFKRDGNSYKNIIDRINPQMIIRFGATFPDITLGKGKQAVIKKDFYQNEPQFDLGAVEAFNKDLVKGVDVQLPPLTEDYSQQYIVKSANKKELILAKDGKEWIVKIGEDLNTVGNRFEGGITYEGYGKLSNDLEIGVGMRLLSGVFSNSYQEILLNMAIEAHFKAEIENFHREGYKVKTNALFFIDSIKSYRNKDGWLKTTFERILKNKLVSLLSAYPEGEYHDFLLATKNNLSLAHGGYFAEDWGAADDSATAEERKDILHKERTLSFKRPDGSWNIRRFFFSKWTLKEGWDNPNVFTICKLRSSGSENSKLQEVGRGLRLPVDEQGNRLAGSSWYLTYIVGFNEKDFADKLIGQVNTDVKNTVNTDKLTAEMIKRILIYRNISEEELLEHLDNAGIIKRDNSFKEGGYNKLVSEYPELLSTQVKFGKIVDNRNKKSPNKIKLRINNWKKIEEFWKEVSKRYMLSFERISTDEITSLFNEALRTEGIFDDNKTIEVKSIKTVKGYDQETISLEYQNTSTKNTGALGKCAYNDFITRFTKNTSVPIQIVHRELWKFLQELINKGIDKTAVNAKLNDYSLANLITRWEDLFAKTFATKYNYDCLKFMAETSVLKNGSFISELPMGDVGNFKADDIKDDVRNLYEKPLAYDSENPEHEILRYTPPEKITVFGKIPKRAIKVPTYTGGSTTPDFVYVKDTGNQKNLYILVETKSNDMRLSEQRVIAAQQKLLSKIHNVKWHLIKKAAEVIKLLNEI